MYKFTLVLVALLTLICTGCSALTHEQREELNFRNEDYRLEFYDFRQRCRARGQRIVIFARSNIGRSGIPNRGDRYYCV